MSTETITLKYPLESGLKTLNMRRPKVRDQRVADKQFKSNMDSIDREITLFANLCEITFDEIDALDMVDYNQIIEKYKSFLS